MKKRILAMFLCISVILPCVACNNGAEMDTEQEIISCGDTQISSGETETNNIPMVITDFSIRLLQTEGENVLYNSGGGMNRLISPFSVLTAMSMVGNGAKNETKEQLEEVLGISIKDLNLYISRYRDNLSQEEGNCFRMANSIWFTEDESFTVKDDFLNLNEEYYGADIYETAFDQSAVPKINQWVEENTDGLIKEIINEIPADAVMYLINALVFDAKWEKTYDKTDIRDAVFTTSDGIEQEVDIMFSTENLYLEDEHATGFMKYYDGRDYAFVALLPNEDMGLAEYMNTLSGEALYNLLQDPTEVKTYAWLPQFEVSYQTELSETLADMGMRDVFSGEKADLSGIGTSAYGNLSVDHVIHKTYIDVSPVGTRAGAATAVEVKAESAPMEPEEVKEVRLDRPFLYMIIDCENNQPIFLGTVNYVHPYRCGIIDDLCGYPLEE